VQQSVAEFNSEVDDANRQGADLHTELGPVEEFANSFRDFKSEGESLFVDLKNLQARAFLHLEAISKWRLEFDQMTARGNALDMQGRGLSSEAQAMASRSCSFCEKWKGMPEEKARFCSKFARLKDEIVKHKTKEAELMAKRAKWQDVLREFGEFISESVCQLHEVHIA
jgi:hypothetical protein